MKRCLIIVLWSALGVASVLLHGGCGSTRTREFAFDAETSSDSIPSKRPLYITGKKSIIEVDPDALILDVWKVETEDYPQEVRVYARVLDSLGNFISGMAEPYYKGEGTYKQYWVGITQYLGGDTVKVTDYTVREYGDQDSIAYVLGLVLDHGGSMAGAIQYLLEAARMFVHMKYPRDQIAVLKFDKKVHVERPLTSDVRQLDSALMNTDLKGYGLYTALYDAMQAGIATVKTAHAAMPRALVVFTDGEDNASAISDAEVCQYARSEHVRIFPVGFGYTNDSTLQRMAELTGGKFYKVKSKKELQAVFKDIYESLRNFYKISYSAAPYSGRTRVKIALNTRGNGERAFDSEGFDKDGYDINGYDRDGYDREGYDAYGYNRQGFDKRGFNKDGLHKNGTVFDDNGYDKEGYDKNGFNREGVNRRGIRRGGTKAIASKEQRFDASGYDREGYDRDGYDRNGFNREGYDREGFGRDGFTRDGWNRQGFGRDGYDRNGYDKDGYDRNGYDRNGFDKQGYDREGFNGAGFNRAGWHRNGTRFDERGFDVRGYGKDGYNAAGFRRDGMHRNGTRWDDAGFDIYGYDREGYDRNGFDRQGRHRNGRIFDNNGYDRFGFDSLGYDREGYDREGYNNRGYDRNGFDRNGKYING
ncbi:MAG: VWA domain-containing protein, partial [Bacteroidota bacterium]|nr:VWA domain-containing protein [Candidatus Kapabacteria bacterium]MDW8221074.1 VWA domain-containing protein [Bacteroidota bacterium]